MVRAKITTAAATTATEIQKMGARRTRCMMVVLVLRVGNPCRSLLHPSLRAPWRDWFAIRPTGVHGSPRSAGQTRWPPDPPDGALGVLLVTDAGSCRYTNMPATSRISAAPGPSTSRPRRVGRAGRLSTGRSRTRLRRWPRPTGSWPHPAAPEIQSLSVNPPEPMDGTDVSGD
jgi:hypothetical protein